jgi:AraC-like DNA-binding protein
VPRATSWSSTGRRCTLRRRLAELGCTFSDLVDEARQELACDALQRPQCSIKEVAYALGFAEPSAFHRAFKRWMGVTRASRIALKTRAIGTPG